MGMYVEEGQYVVHYREGDQETVFATCYGEADVERQLELCRREHPDLSPAHIGWGKAIRVAARRREPWMLEPGEGS